MRRLTLIALAAALATLASGGVSEADAVPPTITYSCTPAPVNCSGWFTSNVTVTWSVNGLAGVCANDVVVVETTGTQVSCTATSSENETVTVTITIKLDKTPPTVTGATPSRAADSNGWWNHALTVAFSGTDATSGIESCTAPGYAGPDNANAVVAGTCRDVAGNTSAPVGAAIKYDATAPEVRAAPERPPDANGWYNHAVSVPFTGSDAASGVSECSTGSYAGPDAAEVVLRGSCKDRAGNVAEGSFALRYDATAPKVTRLAGTAGDGSTTLNWQASADTTAVELIRTPGRAGRAPSVVFRGKATSFRDSKLRNGVRYRYELAAFDQAGNAERKTLALLPRSTLLRPANGARVRVPPLLAWRATKGARLYNVQLYRNGKKILTMWPRRARLRLPGAWVFQGRTYRLAPGRYSWYVWPHANGRYGRLLGSRTFTLVR